MEVPYKTSSAIPYRFSGDTLEMQWGSDGSWDSFTAMKQSDTINNILYFSIGALGPIDDIFSAGDTIVFSASILNISKDSISDTILWLSNIDGVFSSDSRLEIAFLSKGNHILILNVKMKRTKLAQILFQLK